MVTASRSCKQQHLLYKGKVLFKDKLEKANKTFSKQDLPEPGKSA